MVKKVGLWLKGFGLNLRPAGLAEVLLCKALKPKIVLG